MPPFRDEAASRASRPTTHRPTGGAGRDAATGATHPCVKRDYALPLGGVNRAVHFMYRQKRCQCVSDTALTDNSAIVAGRWCQNKMLQTKHSPAGCQRGSGASQYWNGRWRMAPRRSALFVLRGRFGLLGRAGGGSGCRRFLGFRGGGDDLLGGAGGREHSHAVTLGEVRKLRRLLVELDHGVGVGRDDDFGDFLALGCDLETRPVDADDLADQG